MATTGPFSANNSATTTTIQPPSGEKTKAKDIAQYGVATIDKNSSVYQAIALMIKKNVTGLPVVDDSGLVGIISEKDALRLLYETEFVEGCVGDYMTTDVFTFDEQDDLADICQCLIDNSFRRVPVLHDGRLAAIITRADLIKANKEKFRPADTRGVSLADTNLVLAKHVMHCGLLTVRKDTTIYEAMEIIATRDITGLPVVDDSMNLIGILSEKDLLKLLYHPNIKPGLVEDHMTSDVVTFDRNDSFLKICHCLVNNNFRRVPILDRGKLVGIISRTDIMAYIMKNRTKFFSQKTKE
jgi:CBS domain-containing protein